MEAPPESTDGEWKDVPPTEMLDVPPEESNGEPQPETPEEAVVVPEVSDDSESTETVLLDTEDPVEEAFNETGGAPREAPAPSPRNDRQSFFELNFNELDRDLTAEERQEWNSIYASYRGRSALTGTIIGVDPHSISVHNPETDRMER